MRKIISFSVYGHESHYALGAIANAIAAKQFFPEWTARFYLDRNLVAPLQCQLESLGSECVVMDSSDGHSGTFWRFLPASDPSVDVVIVRDVDALLCPRNKYVVDEWIDSGKGFHIIRDHPHQQVPILGGLWGARKGVIRNIQVQLDQWPHKSSYGDDQVFLSRVVYPMIKDSVLVHSDFIYYEDEDPQPIAVKRYGDYWLGFPPARGEITTKRLDDFLKLKSSPIRCLPAPSV